MNWSEESNDETVLDKFANVYELSQLIGRHIMIYFVVVVVRLHSDKDWPV